MIQKLHILNLEDNQNDSELIQAVLERDGIECDIKRVETREEFICALKDGRVDLIIADYSLPSFDGLTALFMAHETCPEIPFIFVSGTLGEDVAVEALKHGATDYVLKNRISRLASAVTRALKETEDNRKRVKTEEELKQLLAILEESPDFIVTADMQGNLKYHNRAAKKMIGLPEDTNLSHLKIRDMHPGWAAKRVEEEGIPAVIMEGSWMSENALLHRDGREIPVSQVLVVHRDASGTPQFLSTIIRDITEHKTLEAQLRQAQKMEAIGQLAGGIAHDFNNIMSAIINYAYLIKNRMNDDDPLRDQIEHISSLSIKASGITRGLLAFSRKSIVNLMPVSINNVLLDMGKLLSKFIGEDIQVNFRLSDRDLIIMADGAHIEQIIINLATNARDAMPDGGTLTLETDTVSIDDDFIHMHGFGTRGAYALLSVTDTGIGMNEETKQKIFEPFFTTKEVGKGTGLGMAIIYGIVKQHEGYINVYSEPGKGTAFKIYFPVAKVAVPEIEETKPVNLTGNGETILLAEDEAAVRNSVRTILEQYGYRVIEAVNGNDAVEKFMEHKDRIDLLFLDVIMPKKNGKEAYEEIKKIAPEVKVIFTSGYSADIIDKKGIIKDGFTHILKPLSPDKLLSTIKEVLQSGKESPQ